MAVPEPKNGNRFTGAEKAEHERRGWIFEPYVTLRAMKDVQPMYVLTGYEESAAMPPPSPDFVLGEFALQKHWHPTNRRTSHAHIPDRIPHADLLDPDRL